MKNYVIATLAGLVMGALIQRVRASNPAMIARNLRLEDLSIIKFMATAIAVGMVLTFAINQVSPVHYGIKPAYLVGVGLGGLIFGVGFGLGGYCPGTCVVGAGEGRKDALWTIAGGILGALVFTLAYSAVVAPINKLMNFGKVTLAQALHLPTWAAVALLAGVLLVTVALLPTNPGRGKAA